MKLISEKKVNGNTVTVYRYPILAGMRFVYKEGKTDKNKMHIIGHYDYEIVTNAHGETVSEKKLETKMYDDRG